MKPLRLNTQDEPYANWVPQCLRCKKRFCTDCILPSLICFYCDIAFKRELIRLGYETYQVPAPYGLPGGGEPMPYPDQMIHVPKRERTYFSRLTLAVPMRYYPVYKHIIQKLTEPDRTLTHEGGIQLIQQLEGNIAKHAISSR